MSDRERVKTALDEMLKYYDAQLNWEGTDVWANELLALIQPGEPVAWAQIHPEGHLTWVSIKQDELADWKIKAGWTHQPLYLKSPQPEREREEEWGEEPGIPVGMASRIQAQMREPEPGEPVALTEEDRGIAHNALAIYAIHNRDALCGCDLCEKIRCTAMQPLPPPKPSREREAMEGWVHRLRRLVEGLGEDYDELRKRVDEIDAILKGGPEDE